MSSSASKAGRRHYLKAAREQLATLLGIRKTPTNPSRADVAKVQLDGMRAEAERSSSDSHALESAVMARVAPSGEVESESTTLPPAAAADLGSAADATKGDEPLLPSGVEEDIADLIPRFVAGLAKDLTELDSALKVSNLQSVVRIAHQLAGLGSTLGYPDITVAARELERLAKAGAPIPDLRRACLVLASLHHRAETGLKASGSVLIHRPTRPPQPR